MILPWATDPALSLPQSTDRAIALPQSTDQAIALPQATDPAIVLPQASDPAIVQPQATDPAISLPQVLDRSMGKVSGSCLMWTEFALFVVKSIIYRLLKVKPLFTRKDDLVLDGGTLR
jgi:hypothetical protein